MRTSTGKIISLGLGLLFLHYGCGTRQTVEEEEDVYHNKETFYKEYDEVWNTLEEIMVEELMYTIKIKNKKRGIIETDWISIIRIRGTLRWKMRVLLDRKDKGTVVKVYNLVEEPTGEIRGKMKNKKGEIKTGWQSSEEKIEGGDDILNLLNVRLEK